MSQLSVIMPDDDNWQKCYQFVNFLLSEKINILWSTEPFSGISSEQHRYDRGTFLITHIPTPLLSLVHAAQERFDISPTQLDAVEDFVGSTLKPLRIAMYGGGGAPFNHARILLNSVFLSISSALRRLNRANCRSLICLECLAVGALPCKDSLIHLARSVAEKSKHLYKMVACISAHVLVPLMPQLYRTVL